MQRTITCSLLAACLCTGGCITMTGPNKERSQIADCADVRLVKDMGVTVGPLGVLLASMVASDYLPCDLDGVEWVDFGEYTVAARVPNGPDDFSLRSIELPGWEPIVRVRSGGGEDLLVCIDEHPTRVRKMLVIEKSGREVMIVKATGNFEKIVANFLESELLDDSGVGEWLADAEMWNAQVRMADAAATGSATAGG